MAIARYSPTRSASSGSRHGFRLRRWTRLSSILFGALTIAATAVTVAQSVVVFERIPSESQRKPRVVIDSGSVVATSVADIAWQRNVGWHTSKIAFSADGMKVVALHGNMLSVFASLDGRLVRDHIVNEPRAIVRTMALSSTDKLAVAAPKYIDLFDLGSTERIERIPCGPCNISALEFSPDGSKLAAQDSSTGAERMNGIGAVRVFDLRTERIATLKAVTGRSHLSFSPDGGRLLATHISYVGSVESLGYRVWDSANLELLRSADFPEWTMGTVAAGSTGSVPFVAVHGNDGNIELSDLTTGAVVWSVPRIPPQFAPRESWVSGTELNRVALAPDGTFVVSYERPVAYDFVANDAGAIVVRSARDGAVLAVYPIAGMADLAIAPDSKSFVYSTDRDHPGTHLALVRVNAAGLHDPLPNLAE